MPRHILAFDLYVESRQEDGSVVKSLAPLPLQKERLFAKPDGPGIPDGIKVDTNGIVYVGCGDGLHVFSAEGTDLSAALPSSRRGSRTCASESPANYTWEPLTTFSASCILTRVCEDLTSHVPWLGRCDMNLLGLIVLKAHTWNRGVPLREATMV
eukprot:scaffold106_cov380-Prasinococcus_capsulatus_cf.AAC.69